VGVREEQGIRGWHCWMYKGGLCCGGEYLVVLLKTKRMLLLCFVVIRGVHDPRKMIKLKKRANNT